MSNAGITNDGLLLRMSEDDFTARGRRQPHRRATAWPSGPRRGCCGPAGAGSSSCRRSSALLGSAGQANYAASKAASSASPARSPASSPSRTSPSTSSRPGPVATDMIAASATTRQAELTAGRARSAASATPEEVAGGGARSSPRDDAGYITGAVIPVDGGLGMGH